MFPEFIELCNSYNEKYHLIDNDFMINEVGEELSWNKWDTNEKRITCENSSVLTILKIGLMIMRIWVQMLRSKYPNKIFDVTLSIDEGEESDDIPPSATVRFYLVRDGFHCISGIDGFEQPVLICSTH